jgi:hypothetical protein
MAVRYQPSDYLHSWQSARQERCRLIIAVSILLHLLFIFGIELEQVTPLHGRPARSKPLSIVLQTRRATVTGLQTTTTSTVVSPIKVTQSTTAQPVSQTILPTNIVQPKPITKKSVPSHQYKKIPVTKPVTPAQPNLPTIPAKTLEPLPNIGIPVIAAPEPVKPSSNLPNNMDNLTVIGIPVQTPAPPLPVQKTIKPTPTMAKPNLSQVVNHAAKPTVPPLPTTSKQVPIVPSVPVANQTKPTIPELPVAPPVPTKQTPIAPPVPIANSLKPPVPELPVATPEPIKPAPPVPVANVPKPVVAEPVLKPPTTQPAISKLPVATPESTQQTPIAVPETSAMPTNVAEQPAPSTNLGSLPRNTMPSGTSAAPQAQPFNKTESMENTLAKPESTIAEPQKAQQSPATKQSGFPKRMTGNMDQLLSRDWNAVMKRTIQATTEPELSYAQQQEKLRKKSASLVFHTQHDYSHLSGKKESETKTQKNVNLSDNIGKCTLSLKPTTEQDIKSGKRQPSASIPINCDF